MAKKKKTVRIDHKHVWKVKDEEEPNYCECEDGCYCHPPISVFAVCSCGLIVERDEIEKILNRFYV